MNKISFAELLTYLQTYSEVPSLGSSWIDIS